MTKFFLTFCYTLLAIPALAMNIDTPDWTHQYVENICPGVKITQKQRRVTVSPGMDYWETVHVYSVAARPVMALLEVTNRTHAWFPKKWPGFSRVTMEATRTGNAWQWQPASIDADLAAYRHFIVERIEKDYGIRNCPK